MNTVAGRVLRIDFQTLGAGNPTPFINLYQNAQRWIQFANPTWSADQITAEAERQTKISSTDNTFYSNPTPPIGATSDIRSKGNEIEINVNPNRYWTVTGSVTETNSVTQNISSSLVNWINDRMEVWSTIVDPSITTANATAEGNPGKLWWKHRYSANATIAGAASFAATAVTPEENFKAFVSAPFAVMAAQEGKNNPQVRRYAFRASTSYQLAGLSDNKWFKNTTVRRGDPLGGQGRHRLLRRPVPSRHHHRPRSQPADLRQGAHLRGPVRRIQDQALARQGRRHVQGERAKPGRERPAATRRRVPRRHDPHLPHHRSATVHLHGKFRPVTGRSIAGHFIAATATVGGDFFAGGPSRWLDPRPNSRLA